MNYNEEHIRMAFKIALFIRMCATLNLAPNDEVLIEATISLKFDAILIKYIEQTVSSILSTPRRN